MQFFKLLALLPLGFAAVSAAPVAEEAALLPRWRNVQPTCDLTPIRSVRSQIEARLSVDVRGRAFASQFGQVWGGVQTVVHSSVAQWRQISSGQYSTIDARIEAYSQIMVNLKATFETGYSAIDGHGWNNQCSWNEFDQRYQRDIQEAYTELHAFFEHLQTVDSQVLIALRGNFQGFATSFTNWNRGCGNIVGGFESGIQAQIQGSIQILATLNARLSLGLNVLLSGGLGLGVGVLANLNLGGLGLNVGVGLGIGIGL